MKATVLGWYGTETLGDRAILDGLLEVLGDYCDVVFLGSLNPFFTERTLYEDSDLLARHNCALEVFDEVDFSQLKARVRDSDLVAMGGGPLMDIQEMYLIYRGFALARKRGIKTALLGCGCGPFNEVRYAALMSGIFRYTDLAVFRDAKSAVRAERLSKGCVEAKVLDDPAVISALSYVRKGPKGVSGMSGDSYTAVNFRDFPAWYYGRDSAFPASTAASIVDELVGYSSRVLLAPMSTFFMGGDDRVFLHRVKRLCVSDNVHVLSKPLSLLQLYDLLAEAELCVGMRYHSVVLQTILNGRNFIVDYTGRNGKIDGFLDMYDSEGFFADRCIYRIGNEKHPSVREVVERGVDRKFNFALHHDPVSQYQELLFR